MNPLTKSVMQEYMQSGYQIIHDPQRNLYLAYNQTELLTANVHKQNMTLRPHYHSIYDLRQIFSGHPQGTHPGANMNNQSALQEIHKLEQIIQDLLQPEKLDKIFDYLPYTKSGKFHRKQHIDLYITNLKETVNQDYFRQTQIALQIIPAAAYFIQNDGMIGERGLDDFAYIAINTQASYTNKAQVEPIIDENGNFRKPAKRSRSQYLPQESLVPGTSYLDNKNSEYLYLGCLDIQYELNFGSCTIRKNIKPGPYYLRITPSTKKRIQQAIDLTGLLIDHFQRSKSEVITSGLNRTVTKRFTSVGTTYFNPPKNKISNLQRKTTTCDATIGLDVFVNQL